jgi:hypothetical protein
MVRLWKQAAIFVGFASAFDIQGALSYGAFRELQRHAYPEILLIDWYRGTYASWESDWNMVGMHLRLAMDESPEFPTKRNEPQ